MLKLMRAMILLIYLLSPLPAIWIVYAANPPAYQTLRNLLPMVLGSISYTWLLAELVISARPKFIERFFGLNHFYQFHGAAAIVAITLSMLHKQLEEAIWSGYLHTVRQFGDLALTLFLVLAGLSLIFMTGFITRRIRILGFIRHWLEKKHILDFKYNVWIHNANVIAIILVFLHVFIFSAFYRQNFWICGVYTVYFLIAFGCYLYHKIIKIKLAKRQPYTLVQITTESPSIHTLVFKRERGYVPPYRAGQFVFIRILDGGISEEEHPFSITSNPNDRRYLSVTVKSIGNYTSSIPKLSPGTHATIEGPYGILGNSAYRTKSDLVLIAGGIGITPMLSILKDLSYRNRKRRVILFWNVPNKSDLISPNLFTSLTEQMPNFTFVPILSREANDYGETGHLNREKIIRYLAAHHYRMKRTHYIICGPSKMMDSAIETLRRLNVQKKKIHYENFSM
ncbi:MAG: FAD-binding oxidoreductase [Sporolactobacillus sp.]|uniref:ferredoxin reductase family protein n=1 Tax=Sporolactobacillus sp. STSJ-5 TaxID=2965076 RepID=UPI002106EA2A|nr:FAD-binding oxidoreductase [Sporolactobacillus sp. STSJ-5]MCQ2010978.1 FAD-binding oxidoreductase [Sporolactobacillus sp. STSJ-5]